MRMWQTLEKPNYSAHKQEKASGNIKSERRSPFFSCIGWTCLCPVCPVLSVRRASGSEFDTTTQNKTPRHALFGHLLRRDRVVLRGLGGRLPAPVLAKLN